MDDSRTTPTGPTVLESRLTGIRNALIRLAFTFLSGGRWFWLFMVGAPLALLVGSRFYSHILSTLVGICLLFLLVFAGSNYRYLDSRVTIDPGPQTFTLEHPDAPFMRARPNTIALDDVERISIVTLADTAMIRFHYRAMRPFSTPDFVIERRDLPAAIDAFRSSGVVISTDGRDRNSEGNRISEWDRNPESNHDSEQAQRSLSWRRPTEPVIRIVTIPLVLLGIPAYVVLERGLSVFIESNAAIIGVVLWAWMIGRQLTAASGIDPDARWSRVLGEMIATGAVLAILIGGGLALRSSFS